MTAPEYWKMCPNFWLWEIPTVSGPMRGQGFTIFYFSHNQNLGHIFP